MYPNFEGLIFHLFYEEGKSEIKKNDDNYTEILPHISNKTLALINCQYCIGIFFPLSWRKNI